MYKKISTKTPIRFSDVFIKKVWQNHNKIIANFNNSQKINTNDGKWRFTQSSNCPIW